MGVVPTDELERLHRLADERHGDPFAALRRLDAMEAHGLSGPEAEGRASWTRGLLLHDLARPHDAVAAFRRAIAVAQGHGLADVEARSRANLAITLLQLGCAGESAREMAAAVRLAPPSAFGVVTHLAALHAQRCGRHVEAMARYAEALPALEAVGDAVTIGVLHLNRSVALGYLDDHAAARAACAAAEAVAVEHDLVILAAMAAHNLGFLEGRCGRLADGLLTLDRAERWYDKLEGRPRQLSVLFADRAEVLLLAGLAADARAAAAEAVDALQRDGNLADLNEARLLFARACLAAGDADEARTAAAEAACGFRLARRAAWAVQACFVGRQAEFARAKAAGGPVPASLARRFGRLAETIAHDDWPLEKRDAFVYAALSAVGHDPAQAERFLASADAIDTHGATAYRSRWHHAHALVSLARGDPLAAAAHVRQGIRDASTVTGASGSTEATLTALRYAGDLAQLGVEVALATGRVGDVLHAVERQRAVVAHLPSVRRGDGSDDAGPPASPSPCTGSERDRRERALRTAGAGAAPDRFRWSAFRRTLGDACAVFHVEAHGRLLAVIVDRGTSRLVELGTVDDVVRQREFTLFALASFAFAPEDRRARAAARLWRDAAQLDASLVAPLGLRDRPVVIVPAPSTEGVPWSILPSLGGNDVSIAPSAESWLHASARAGAAPGRVVLVAGPGLPAAEREVARLAERYPHAVTLAGDDATVAHVAAALEGADLVHIASHGVFRDDSPMFSHVELVDGPLTVYDLEGLRRPPRTVVLSACEAAAARLFPSGGALGTARALLAVGSSVVVAALLAVEDEATSVHMQHLHAALAAGARPARALRLASRAALASGDRNRIAAAAAFVTIGAG